MAEQTERPNKFAARIPGVLYARMKDEAKKREVSANVLLVDALRKELDGPGPEQRDPVQNSAPQISENSVPEIAPLNTERSAVVMVPAKHGMSQMVPGESPDWKFEGEVGVGIPRPPKFSAAELAQKFGLKTLATIEEVEPRCDPESGYIPPEFVAVPDPVSEEEAFRQEFVAEFGRQAWNRAIRIPSFKKAKWPERFEMAREQRERE